MYVYSNIHININMYNVICIYINIYIKNRDIYGHYNIKENLCFHLYTHTFT